jgi:hypothetical protein
MWIVDGQRTHVSFSDECYSYIYQFTDSTPSFQMWEATISTIKMLTTDMLESNFMSMVTI